MLKNLIAKLKESDYAEMKGSHIHCELPITKSVLNFFLKDLSDKSEVLKSLQIGSIDKKKLTFELSLMPVSIAGRDFELVDRTIECKLLPTSLQFPDFSLNLKVTDGINFIERKLIEGFVSTILAKDGLEFDDKVLSIDHSKLTEINKLNHITQKLKNVSIETVEDKVWYKFDLEF